MVYYFSFLIIFVPVFFLLFMRRAVLHLHQKKQQKQNASRHAPEMNNTPSSEKATTARAKQV